MPTTFHIPRQSDRTVVAALGRIKLALNPLIPFRLVIVLPKGGEHNITSDDPENDKSLAYIFDASTAAIEYFYLRDQTGRAALSIYRKMPTPHDEVTIHDDWAVESPTLERSHFWVALLSSARTELRAPDLEATFKGSEDNAWNRYRDAQAEVVNSLQQTSETLLVKIAERNLQLDNERNQKYATLESALREELSKQRAALEKQAADRQASLGQREKAIADRESAFQTKEARYVARQEMKEQMKQLKDWLEHWKLTDATEKKRWLVAGAYLLAIVVTGFLTIYATVLNYQILSSPDGITKLLWQQWVGLGLKTLFPFAAFTTFVVYFIRWSAAWARQHADEEFRNRSRLIDIGRASWLLETVHDAQEHKTEIPTELLKELSRNMFAHNPGGDSDSQPQAAAEVLLQGLSSLRVKSPDGTEVEAKREDQKK